MRGELCQQGQSLRSPDRGPPNGTSAKHSTGLIPRQHFPVNWTVSRFQAPFPHREIDFILIKIEDIIVLDFGGVQSASVPAM